MERWCVVVKDKMILITKCAIGICSIVLAVFWGLGESVWQDAPRTYSITMIVAILMAVALVTNSWFTMWKKRRVKKGLEQWAAESKRSGQFENLLRIIFCLVLVTLIVVGIVFQNHELSIIGGAVLAVMVTAHIASVLIKRAKKREQDEKDDVEDPKE